MWPSPLNHFVSDPGNRGWRIPTKIQGKVCWLFSSGSQPGRPPAREITAGDVLAAGLAGQLMLIPSMSVMWPSFLPQQLFQGGDGFYQCITWHDVASRRLLQVMTVGSLPWRVIFYFQTRPTLRTLLPCDIPAGCLAPCPFRLWMRSGFCSEQTSCYWCHLKLSSRYLQYPNVSFLGKF